MKQLRDGLQQIDARGAYPGGQATQKLELNLNKLKTSRIAQNCRPSFICFGKYNRLHNLNLTSHHTYLNLKSKASNPFSRIYHKINLNKF